MLLRVALLPAHKRCKDAMRPRATARAAASHGQLRTQWLALALAVARLCFAHTTTGAAAAAAATTTRGGPGSNQHEPMHATAATRRLTTAAADGDGRAAQPQPAYSAICVVAKDENRYVREWVQYHKCLGVGHVYLYDHGSAVALRGEVQDFIDRGFLTYTANITDLAHTKYKEGFSSNLERFMTTIQGQVYKDCLERHGHKHTFVGFIDVDEFVVLLDAQLTSINQLLQPFEAYGGVSLYWTLLGSSGHDAPPPGGVVDSYTRCTPARHHVNTQFKSFVNTRFKPVMYSPHRAHFMVEGPGRPPAGSDDEPPPPVGDAAAPGDDGGGVAREGGAALDASQSDGVFLVNEVGQRIPRGRNKQGSHQRATVYHYATRSKADFLAKLRRGGGAGVTRPPHYLRRLDKQCTETCRGAIDTFMRTCQGERAS